MLSAQEYNAKLQELVKRASESVKAKILSETKREDLLNINFVSKINFVQESIFEVRPESKTFSPHKILKFHVSFNVPSLELLSDQNLSNVQSLLEQQLYDIVKNNAPKAIQFNSVQPKTPIKREVPKEFNHKPILIGLSMIAAALIGTALYIEHRK